MQKREFEEMIEQPVSDAEYRVIETVYQWHPSVKEVSGKEEVAELYKSFGMAIFHDMLPRAEKARCLEEKLHRAKKEVEQIKEEMETLACGGTLKEEKAAPGMLDGYGIKEMLDLVKETLTRCLNDTHITKACKERIRHCMIKEIDDIYKNAFQGEVSSISF